MKIVRFLGGLGNQMFQYAFYKALQERFSAVKADLSAFENYELHNGFELEKIFSIAVNKAHPFVIKLYDPSFRDWHIRKLRRVFNLKNAFYEEKQLFDFDETPFQDNQSRLYWGYWQNEKYFEDIAAELRKDFLFKHPLTEKNQAIFDQVKTSNSVAIHVRRGDYLHSELLGGICDKDYYQRAIGHILERTEYPKFFVFSNDINWCRLAFNLPDVTYISWNNGALSYVDMQLMSVCKHNIIANSSFSWWSAWLNVHPEKIVIAPEKWTNDPNHLNIVPQSWIQL